jgi:KDO2-lipid IV(A) lauroyltransferase
MLASLGFTTIAAVARVFPARAGYLVARGGARVHYALAPRRRAAVRANLSQVRAFVHGSGRQGGELPPAAAALATFENHASLLFEWLRASAGARYPLPLDGRDRLDEALDRGRGAILVTCHLGNWEVAAAELARAGYPLTVVTGEQLGYLAAAVRRDKARRGIAVVRPADGMRALYRQLAQNRIIILLVDGDIYWRGQPIDFLGTPASLPWGAVRLARSTGAPLFAATMRRTGPGAFRAAIHPPIDPAGDPRAVMRSLLAPLEQAIAGDPSQWCLFRPLWGDRAPGRESLR